MSQCCSNCACKFTPVKLDYSKRKGKTSNMKGYICVEPGFNGTAIWIVGVDPDSGHCDCYIPKEENNEAIREN